MSTRPRSRTAEINFGFMSTIIYDGGLRPKLIFLNTKLSMKCLFFVSSSILFINLLCVFTYTLRIPTIPCEIHLQYQVRSTQVIERTTKPFTYHSKLYYPFKYCLLLNYRCSKIVHFSLSCLNWVFFEVVQSKYITDLFF